MVILLQMNKITSEKSENLEKNSHKSEPCQRKLLFFLKSCPGGNNI